MKPRQLVINIEAEDGKKMTVPVEDLKEALKDIIRSKQKNVKLKLSYEGDKDYIVNLDLPFARKIIKLSNILNESIIPDNLKKYIVDLTERYALKNTAAMVGRDEEIEKIWFYLSQERKNDVFIVGEADVGKTAIVREIARQIATNECPKEFYEHRILLLRSELLVNLSGTNKLTKIVSQIEKLMKKNKDKIIVFIDKALYMKIDVDLLMLLYTLIRSYKIPVIMTLRGEDFIKLFLKDGFLEKYQNIVEVDEPEYDEIYPMIKNKIGGIQKKYGIKISEEMAKFAIFTSSLVCSSRSNIGNSIDTIEKACMEAKVCDKDAVDKKSILKCYDSYKKMYKNMDKDEIKRIAYHETGHFLTLIKSPNIKGTKTLCVSILPMMDFLGVNMSCPVLGKDLHKTKDYMIDYIAMLLGGRVAENKLTHDYSTGASSDLAIANMEAEKVAMKYALLGGQRTYMDDYRVKTYLLTEAEKAKTNRIISSILEEAYSRAEGIIDDNMDLLEAIVEKLVEEEVLTGEELEKLINDFEKPKPNT